MDNIFRAVGCPCVSFSPAVGVCTGVQASAATKEQKDEGWEDMECDLPDVPAPQDSDEECEPTTKAEFQKWRSTFRNNVELAAEILQDRPLWHLNLRLPILITYSYAFQFLAQVRPATTADDPRHD